VPRFELAIGSLLVAGVALVGLLGQVWLDVDPMEGNLLTRFTPPDAEHFFGTDNLGRDLVARVMAGLRWSMAAALLATSAAAIIGTTLGLLAAETEGWLRRLVLGSIDLVLAFPGLVAAIVVIAVVGQGFWPLVLTLGLLSWPVFARVIYAESLKLLAQNYVLAARLSGAGSAAVLIGHLLPALKGTLAVMLAFHFADMLIAESALSFLGLAAPLGEPTWGNMLAESRPHLFRAPWMLFVPAGAIVLVVVAANLVGDGLARNVDPKGELPVT
jgi:peptide/nickel transport system permease protein